MPNDPFLIHISDLLDRPGAHRRASLSGSMAVELDQMEACGPVGADLRIEVIHGGVLVRGEATASMHLRCNRCLGAVAFEAAAPVVQTFGEESGADILPIGRNGTIDISEVLHDELCLSVPLVPLCSEACRGLCPSCGNDLNTDPCEGHSEVEGSPFSALGGFLEASAQKL